MKRIPTTELWGYQESKVHLACFDPPDYAKGTITSFRTTQKNIYGDMPENKFRSDIMEVILVCLDKEVCEKACEDE